jgi:DNA-binding response OmpR family regulator
MLPDGKGFDFCNEIRDKTDAHIIFVTAKKEHDERLFGLTIGGDDYLDKPFHIKEMLLKVDTIMKRRKADKAPAQILTKGALMLNIAAVQATANGKDLILTPKEFSLLLTLVQNEGKTVSAEDLYKMVWNAPLSGDKNALIKSVSRLRTKIENTGYTITSHRGTGYAFEKI